jgi:hypothetical protein
LAYSTVFVLFSFWDVIWQSKESFQWDVIWQSIIKRLVAAVEFRGRCLPHGIDLRIEYGLVLVGLDDQKNRKRSREGLDLGVRISHITSEENPFTITTWRNHKHKESLASSGVSRRIGNSDSEEFSRSDMLGSFASLIRGIVHGT